ncbi:hypothetical protein NEMBOFW57_000039 [Staphylotrichum longicolle]|uniref:Uncharacterized protein n=1 Tax=Staphylotrichum longicolle TaxID=669026 RepID=A0AAD4F216_9PEZI|nr:hypothetical protein NEMBOFW57_000039 [Staphylotrichum longicolle]
MSLGPRRERSHFDFEPFEMEMMPGQPSTTYNFTWSDSSSRAVGVLGKASVPIASGIPGLDATASIGALFGKKVANYSHFARLDYWMTFPSRLYVNDCLRRREVEDHIKRVSSIFGGWTMYMITGLAIARGCEIGPELSFETSNSSTMTGERATDFIWAIKLAKITKNGLQKDWTVESVTGRDGLLGKRATFSVDAGDQLFNPVPVLIHEGLDASEFDVSSVNFGKEEYYISLVDEKEEEEQPAQDGEEDPGLAASQCALAGQGGVPPEGFKEGGGMVLV